MKHYKFQKNGLDAIETKKLLADVWLYCLDKFTYPLLPSRQSLVLCKLSSWKQRLVEVADGPQNHVHKFQHVRKMGGEFCTFLLF